MQVDRVLTAFYSWHEGKCGKRRHKGTRAQRHKGAKHEGTHEE